MNYLTGQTYIRATRKTRGKYMTEKRREIKRRYQQIAVGSFIVGFIFTLVFLGGKVRASSGVIHNQVVEEHQGFGQVAPLELPKKLTPTPIESNKYDLWIDKYSKKYGVTTEKYLHTKQLLHCMIYRESRYGENKGQGDGGKAGGVMQFWEGTYLGYRKLMIKSGYTDQIGSRDNPEQAISTAAWAINNGRAKAWGPVARKECE